MTADAFSDFVLVLVCAHVYLQTRKSPNTRAGLGLAAQLIGFAALWGVIRFSSWQWGSEAVRGVHQFFSLFASVGAFPLLAFGLWQPNSPIAMRTVGAAWTTLVVGAYGVAAVLFGFKLWAVIAPALSVLCIVWVVLFRWQGKPRGLGLLGVCFLCMGFAAHLAMPPGDTVAGVLNKTQLLHYALALALLFLHAASKTLLLQRPTPSGLHHTHGPQ